MIPGLSNALSRVRFLKPKSKQHCQDLWINFNATPEIEHRDALAAGKT